MDIEQQTQSTTHIEGRAGENDSDSSSCSSNRSGSPVFCFHANIKSDDQVQKDEDSSSQRMRSTPGRDLSYLDVSSTTQQSDYDELSDKKSDDSSPATSYTSGSPISCFHAEPSGTVKDFPETMEETIFENAKSLTEAFQSVDTDVTVQGDFMYLESGEDGSGQGMRSPPGRVLAYVDVYSTTQQSISDQLSEQISDDSSPATSYTSGSPVPCFHADPAGTHDGFVESKEKGANVVDEKSLTDEFHTLNIDETVQEKFTKRQTGTNDSDSSSCSSYRSGSPVSCFHVDIKSDDQVQGDGSSPGMRSTPGRDLAYLDVSSTTQQFVSDPLSDQISDDSNPATSYTSGSPIPCFHAEPSGTSDGFVESKEKGANVEDEKSLTDEFHTLNIDETVQEKFTKRQIGTSDGFVESKEKGANVEDEKSLTDEFHTLNIDETVQEKFTKRQTGANDSDSSSCSSYRSGSPVSCFHADIKSDDQVQGDQISDDSNPATSYTSGSPIPCFHAEPSGTSDGFVESKEKGANVEDEKSLTDEFHTLNIDETVQEKFTKRQTGANDSDSSSCSSYRSGSPVSCFHADIQSDDQVQKDQISDGSSAATSYTSGSPIPCFHAEPSGTSDGFVESKEKGANVEDEKSLTDEFHTLNIDETVQEKFTKRQTGKDEEGYVDDAKQVHARTRFMLDGSVVECQICCFVYDELRHLPRKMPCCLQPICNSCLQNIRQDNTVRCPFCNYEHEVLGRRISLPVDPIMLKVVDLLKIQRGIQLPCTDCPDKDIAQYRCDYCCVFLCEECHRTHARHRLTRHHETVTFNEMRGQSLERFRNLHQCNEHHEAQAFFCRTCKQVICVFCAKADHDKCCDVVYVEEAHQEMAKLTDDMLDKLGQKSFKLEQHVKKLEEKKTEIKLLRVSAWVDVKGTMDHTKKLKDTRNISLLCDLNMRLDHELKVTDETLELKTGLLAKVESSTEYIRTMREMADQVEELQLIVSSTDALNNILQDLTRAVKFNVAGAAFSPVRLTELDFNVLFNNTVLECLLVLEVPVVVSSSS